MRAREVLAESNVPLTEHIMDDRNDELRELKQLHGHSTVPIILIDGKLVGGFDDLEALVRSGALD
ncbi:MAG TPA: glutaredoxin [Planctomycetota bacterium]|nr:glutaredoxin [Planctomycetota bacterium]